MKKILFAAVALVAMASCATDEVVSRPDNKLAIEFDNAFVENSTRAADINKDNLANFGVYGSVINGQGQQGMVFENKKVTVSEGKYTYEDPQYWIEGASYDFLAFAPFADAKWAYDPTIDTVAKNGTISFDNEAAQANQDFLFAYAAKTTESSLTSAPAPVAFTFNHMLSRVKFTITNGFTAGSNIKLDITNLTITNAHSEGTLAIENGVPQTWAVGSNVFARNFGSTTQLADNNTSWTTEHFYLIPTKAAYNVTFDVTVHQAGVEVDTYSRTATVTLDMEKGKSYNVKASLDPSNTAEDGKEIYPIEFTVASVEEWEEFGDVDATIPEHVVSTAQELATAVAEGGAIVLTQDINLDDIATTRATFGLFIEKDCVIDGAGHTFTSTSGRAIAVSGANNVTLKNFTLQATGERGIQVQGNAKNVTIENVTATAANYTVSLPSSAGATVVTINNCDLKGLNTINVAAPGSKVTVNNTTLRCEDNVDEGYSVVCINKDGVGASVTVNGGEVIITGSNTGSTCGGSVEATGATLTFNETKGNTTIRDYGFAIEYGDYYYSFPTFEAALAKAVEGETIVLLQDITIESHLSINKNVNLDLNGKTITVDIKGGVGDDAIWVRDNAESVISNGAIRFINEVESTVYASGIFATGTSKVTIKDMDIVAVAEAVFAQANASVEILSGSFKSTEHPEFTLNLKDSARATASIVVKGGKYFQFNPADNAAEGEHTNFVAAGYKSVANGEWYEVVAE